MSKRKTTIEAEVAAIAAAHRGRLTPALVARAAQKKGTALHSHFAKMGAFDGKTAMARLQIIIARDVIRFVSIPISTTTCTFRVPAYIRDPSVPAETQGYATIAVLRSESDNAHAVLVSEFSRAAACLVRAKAVAAALALSDEVERIHAQVFGFVERLGGSEPLTPGH